MYITKINSKYINMAATILNKAGLMEGVEISPLKNSDFVWLIINTEAFGIDSQEELEKEIRIRRNALKKAGF